MAKKRKPEEVFVLGAHQYWAVIHYLEDGTREDIKHIEEASDPMHEVAICGQEGWGEDWVSCKDPRPWCEKCLAAMRRIGQLADELMG